MNLFSLFFGNDGLEKTAQAHPELFPMGGAQLDQETRALWELIHKRLSLNHCQTLLVQIREAIHAAVGITDKNSLRDRLTEAVGDTLTLAEIDLVLLQLTGLNGTLYSGGDGRSVETAVQICTTNPRIGIELEQRWLRENLGTKHQDWQTQDQALHQREGRYYDVYILTLSDGSERSVIFDITSFFQKTAKN